MDLIKNSTIIVASLWSQAYLWLLKPFNRWLCWTKRIIVAFHDLPSPSSLLHSLILLQYQILNKPLELHCSIRRGIQQDGRLRLMFLVRLIIMHLTALRWNELNRMRNNLLVLMFIIFIRMMQVNVGRVGRLVVDDLVSYTKVKRVADVLVLPLRLILTIEDGLFSEVRDG